MAEPKDYNTIKEGGYGEKKTHFYPCNPTNPIEISDDEMYYKISKNVNVEKGLKYNVLNNQIEDVDFTSVNFSGVNSNEFIRFSYPENMEDDYFLLGVEYYNIITGVTDIQVGLSGKSKRNEQPYEAFNREILEETFLTPQSHQPPTEVSHVINDITKRRNHYIFTPVYLSNFRLIDEEIRIIGGRDTNDKVYPIILSTLEQFREMYGGGLHASSRKIFFDRPPKENIISIVLIPKQIVIYFKQYLPKIGELKNSYIGEKERVYNVDYTESKQDFEVKEQKGRQLPQWKRAGGATEPQWQRVGSQSQRLPQGQQPVGSQSQRQSQRIPQPVGSQSQGQQQPVGSQSQRIPQPVGSQSQRIPQPVGTPSQGQQRTQWKQPQGQQQSVVAQQRTQWQQQVQQSQSRQQGQQSVGAQQLTQSQQPQGQQSQSRQQGQQSVGALSQTVESPSEEWTYVSKKRNNRLSSLKNNFGLKSRKANKSIKIKSRKAHKSIKIKSRKAHKSIKSKSIKSKSIKSKSIKIKSRKIKSRKIKSRKIKSIK